MQPTPKPDALQRYGADLSDWAYSQATVRRMLNDAHVHYEAQIRPLAGLARPEAQWPLVMGDARIDAMASAGKASLLAVHLESRSAELTKAHDRIDSLVEAMKDAARTLEGAHLSQDGQEVAYTVAKGLRRAAE